MGNIKLQFRKNDRRLLKYIQTDSSSPKQIDEMIKTTKEIVKRKK